MKKQKKQDKRIYVIVPKTVQPTRGYASVSMEPGRLMAQCAHVARMLEHDRGEWPKRAKYEEVTTIVLSVRNSRELSKVFCELNDLSVDSNNAFEVFNFFDTNPGFYGTGNRVMTAVCTSPVLPEQVSAAIAHLELYV